MKLLQFQKPISSPGRVDNNFPPPLLRFLRSNGGSRSRGRSRSSPIFIRKKNETNGGAETQEPTSPEVTCMGQVRVTRSSSKQIKKKTLWKSKSKSKKTKKKSRCWWVRRAWNRLNWKSNKKVRDFKLFWWRWVSCFQFGFQGKVEIEEKTGGTKREETEEEEKRKAKVFASSSSSSSYSSSTPPKNALLLMRCRSEPYRASSLANRFWGSPSNEEETEQQQHETEHEKKNREEEEEEEKPTLKRETICRDSAIEPRKPPEIEEKFGFCQGLESSNSSTNKDETLNKTRNGGGLCNSSSRPPLILTRCKSEPARRTEKFDPDTCFWKTRLGFVDICTTRI